MREYLFRGKRVDNGEWVEGYYVRRKDVHRIINFQSSLNAEGVRVFPESVGMYTDMKEFVVSDRSYNKPLFEGDIVEVWSTRTPKYMNPQSQYDGDVKARAVIHFKYGRWSLDYDNEYNKTICRLHGNEQTERSLDTWDELHHFQCHSNDEDWYREHNARYKWHDIKKIGTVFENADLLEG